jgi:hypothetical protein
MLETKYGKYIFQYDPDKDKGRRPAPTTPHKMIMRFDNTNLKGSNFYFIHWVMPHPAPFLALGHPPHIHKDAELLFHIGTNPDDPTDLGAEVEIYLGKEMERHVFNKSCVIFIPPNFIHCPYRSLKTTRPWIFMETNQGSVHTEKAFLQLLTEEMWDIVNNDPLEKGRIERFKHQASDF